MVRKTAKYCHAELDGAKRAQGGALSLPLKLNGVKLECKLDAAPSLDIPHILAEI